MKLIVVRFSLIILFLAISVRSIATTYTTSGGHGTWSNAAAWVGAVPPDPLLAGDSIIINHAITNYDVTQDVRGVMLINSTGSITGTEDLKIGKGAINQGTLINYGTINIDKLEVKPDNGCTSADALSIAHNYGTITANNNMHVGNNCGAGRLNNYTGGKVYVTGTLHLDGAICNQDTMIFSGIVKVHGGLLECCGYIETPEIDVDQNPSGRPANLTCTNICSSGGGDPILDFDGVDYSPLSSVPSNPTDYSIDTDSTAICGAAIGGPALPIDLISFEANVNDDRVDIKWITATEINNDFFTVERSVDTKTWIEVVVTAGAGNSNQLMEYFEADYEPLTDISYYRLKQTDYNGDYSYSNIVPVKYVIDVSVDGTISLYPSPVSVGETMHIKFKNIFEAELLVVLRDIQGKEFYSKVVVNIEDGKLVGVPIETHIPSGVYLVTATSENQMYSQKLIIK